MNITAPKLFTSAPLPTNLPAPAKLTPVAALPDYNGDDLFVDHWEPGQFASYSPAQMQYSDGTSTVLRSSGNLLETVAAAREIARTKQLDGNPGQSDFGQGIYQAADGAYYVTLLGDFESTDTEELVTLHIDGNEHVETYSDQICALVDADDWVQLG